MTSNTYLINRLKKFQLFLKKEKIEGFIIDNPIDIFYLTGLALSLGRLIIKQKEAALLVDGRYFHMCEQKSPIPVIKNSPESLKGFLRGLKSVGFDSQTLTVAQYDNLQKQVTKKLIKIANPLKNIRAIKDKEEIKALKKSAKLLWKGFLHIKKLLKEGITEKALAQEFEIYSLKQGASKLAFEPIIAFGDNSAMPHHRAAPRRLKKGDVVLIDIGVVVDHYHSDMTRILYFGEKNSQIVSLEKIVKEAHRAALLHCKPGTKLRDLDCAARHEMKKAGREDLFTHSLGHGVGLEIHEFPKIRKEGEDQDVILKPGMALTIEPGLYLPGVGGVRHEDTILITEEGYDNFYD